MSKFPGQPIPKLPEGKVTLVNEVIYLLKFIKGNGLESKLVRFDESLDIVEVIKSAKRYCEINRYRFVFIEPAITTIPANNDSSDIIE